RPNEKAHPQTGGLFLFGHLIRDLLSERKHALPSLAPFASIPTASRITPSRTRRVSVQTHLQPHRRLVGTKVGHCQAPHKRQSPPREGFVVCSSAFAGSAFR